MGNLEMLPPRLLVLLSVFVFLQTVASQDLQENAEKSAESPRKPKLFYVTTQSTTSTVTTVSFCVQSTDSAITACSGKKKRSLGHVIKSNPIEELEDESIFPSDVQSGRVDGEERGARFLVYWLTTTSTTMITSYTSTSTVASIACTPSGFPYGQC